ncbi:MAG: hypothetical protein WBW02_01400, partial [Candidatus Sulfotelmatobacter sp.]
EEPLFMTINSSSGGEPNTAATVKKPYEKPSFRFDQVFVTSALNCGKVSPVDSNCQGLSAKVS